MRKALAAVAVLAAAAAPAPASAQVPTTGDVVLPPNVAYNCNRAVNFDRLVIMLTTLEKDAFIMNSNCTGRVGRLEVTTFTQDPLKTTNANTAAAHDLVVESGWAACPTRVSGAHQDGWQAMGGARITIRDFVWDCGDMADQFGSGARGLRRRQGRRRCDDADRHRRRALGAHAGGLADGGRGRERSLRRSRLGPLPRPNAWCGTFRVLGEIEVVTSETSMRRSPTRAVPTCRQRSRGRRNLGIEGQARVWSRGTWAPRAGSYLARA